MLFTNQEIETALDNARSDFPRGLEKTHPNYAAIVEYLTGQTSTLGPLQQDYANMSCIPLINLTGSDLTSEKAQRILDVLFEPAVLVYTRDYLRSALTLRLFEDDTPTYFNWLRTFYRNKGVSDQEFFHLVIDCFRHPDSYALIRVPDSPTRRFLVDTIKSSALSANSFYGDVWNAGYFLLLEEARPEWVDPYIRSVVPSRYSGNAVTFLAGFKDGLYLPHILESLEEIPADFYEYQGRMEDVFSLYMADPEKFRDLALSASLRYLGVYTSKHEGRRWERHFDIEGRNEESLPISASAFHLLFTHERQQATTILQQWLDDGVYPPTEVFSVAHRHLKAESLPYFKRAFGPAMPGDKYLRDLLNVGAQLFPPTAYLEELWALTDARSKPTRDLAARTLSSLDPEVMTKAIQLLEHKKAAVRVSAAIILGQHSSEAAREAMARALNKETNDASRDILLNTIADTLPATLDKPQVKKMIEAAKQRGKLKRPVEAFIDEESLPRLTFSDGEVLQPEETRFLLYRMSRNEPNNIDKEASYVLELLDKSSSGPFAAAVLQLYMDNGGQADQKWLMTIAAALGTHEEVDAIRIQVDKWLEASRYKMAEYGIGALALQGSNKAMRWVEWYSRKYSSKKANVGAAAFAALEAAAERQGITLHELGDKIVPDFGFEGLFKTFTAGGEEYRAFVDSKFKLTFFNEDNKRLKSLPSSATPEQQQEFKAIAKEVREVVKAQSPRLEYYLITQRKWTTGQWQTLFLNNPVMFIYATRLLWGVYESVDEKPPIRTFICEDDTTLIDSEDEELSLDAGGYIGIVHPVHLDAAALRKWQEKLFDREVNTIFPQLDRMQTDLSDIDLSATILHIFEGRHMKTGSIRSTLDAKGWQKGPVGDGGFIGTYRLLHRGRNIEVILELEGVGAGFGWTNEEKLGRLYIVDKNKARQPWFYPTKENADQLVPLKDVPTIFLNEMLAAIESIKKEENG